MLRLKKGVRLRGLRAEMLVALAVVQEVYRARGYECVVTSGLDGEHSEGSKHYIGGALDFRTKRLGIGEQESKDMAIEIRKSLNGEASNWVGEFDVIWHDTHLHVEFDPPRSEF